LWTERHRRFRIGFGNIRLQVDRSERAIGAQQITRAFRKADAFEPESGEANLRHFATRRSGVLIGFARGEQARGDDAPVARDTVACRRQRDCGKGFAR